MKKRILSCLMALALCLTLLPTAALAEEPEGAVQTPPAVEESKDPANGEAKPENQPEAPEQKQPAEQEEQQEDSAAKQDEAVAAVQAMIDALPDAAELDGMNDEEAMEVYEAFQTACEAYYDLTEGQREQLKNTEKLAALSDWFSQSAALAAETHKHYRCNGKDAKTGADKCTEIGHTETKGVVTFEPWKETTSLPKDSGHYYLMEDVTLDSAWSITGTNTNNVAIILCLNGHSIKKLKNTASSNGVIQINEHATLALCDCDGSNLGMGTITGSTESSGVYIDNLGAFFMYGGSISGNGNGVTNKELFQMCGGSIMGNDCGVGNLAGTFTMYDGRITGNRNTKYPYGKGGGVCVEGGAFDMHGGSITGNSVSGSRESYGGGVFVDSGCRFTMDGGSITGNTAGNYGGGVYVNSNDFTVSGDVTISSNTAGSKTSSKTSNVYLPSDKTVTVGGALDKNASIGVTTEKTVNEGNYVTVAEGKSRSKSDSSSYTLMKADLTHIESDNNAYGKQLFRNSVVFTKGELHAHPICGKTGCTDGKHHDSVIWKGVTSLDDITGKGYYYLTQDVELTNKSWTVPTGDVVLCLNGYSITGPAIESAITVDSNVTFTLTDCNSSNTGKGTVTHNKDAKGRGVYVNGGIFKMYGGSITGNKVTDNNSYGGGVCVSNRGQFTMSGSAAIAGNTATNDGGGVAVMYGGQFTMSGSASIAGNTADNKATNGRGGGVFVFGEDSAGSTVYKSSFKMYGGSITGNTAKNGGGVYVGQKGTFTMESGTIGGPRGNTATSGGGVYVYGGTFTMTNGSITRNTADSGSGGVCVSGGTFTMNNGSITGNTANTSDGGGVCVSGGTFTMTNGNITGNKTSRCGGGV